MATTIKNNKVKIFSIGIDVGGQTIQNYINYAFTDDKGVRTYNSDGSPKWESFSVVDCPDGTYSYVPYGDVTFNIDWEIGDASSTSAYENWLGNSIGSGYYYRSTDSAGLEAAYDKIFAEIKRLNIESSAADWVAEDPLPIMGSSDETKTTTVEFIGFYTNGEPLKLVKDKGGLTGEAEVAAENTATFDEEKSTIDWDLKKSGYMETVTVENNDTTTLYNYKLVYRVRLQNESDAFEENVVLDTNDKTTLTYRYISDDGSGNKKIEEKSLDFMIPSVHGYLAELPFQKTDQQGNPLPGTVFTLRHDTKTCALCHGDETYTNVPGTYTAEKEPFVTATADADGKVSFTRIPSGHTYILSETPPAGIGVVNPQEYTVVVAFDKITITPDLNGTVVNTLTELTISKTLLQGTAEDEQLPFDFEVKLTPPDGVTLNDSYTAVHTTADGTKNQATLQLKNNVGSVQLKHGESFTVLGLPVGTKAVITETDGDGYKVTYTVDDTAGVGPKAEVTIPASGSTTVAYVNETMFELPHTGGPGSDTYTWAGIMLCMISALVYRNSRRRKGVKQPT